MVIWVRSPICASDSSIDFVIARPSETMTTMAQVPTTTPIMVSSVLALRRKRFRSVIEIKSNSLIVVLEFCRSLLSLDYGHNDNDHYQTYAANSSPHLPAVWVLQLVPEGLLRD